jgi:hypothetical protein
VINFNHGWAHNGFDQHGLVVVEQRQKKGSSESMIRAGFTGNSTPGSKSVIEMEPVGTGWGSDLTAGGTGDAFEYSQFAEEDLAHELAHGCSVWHHGDCDVNGDKDGLTWREERDGTFSEESGNQSRSITILNAAGTEHLSLPNGVSILELRWMAVPHGQHSGDVSSFMCYKVANCFRRDDGPNRYVIPNYHWPLVSQSHLCTSASGTGVNGSGTPGGPWLSNAYTATAGKERGNCTGQICVNDLNTYDSKHARNYTCP